jgi:cell division septation protein DedD
MSLKTIAVILLLPVTFVLLTSCGPTEGDRQRQEIARQDSVARIRADSIAMAFNQNIDQAGDIRTLMEQSKKPANITGEESGVEVDGEPDPASQTRQTEKSAPRLDQPRTGSPSPVQQAQPQRTEQKAVNNEPARSEPASQPARQTAAQRETSPVAMSQQPAVSAGRSAASPAQINPMDELAPSVSGGRFTVQLGTWKNEKLAEAEAENLRGMGLTNIRLIRLGVSDEDNLFYVIRMGRYEDLITARQQVNYLNMEFERQAVVVDLNPSS